MYNICTCTLQFFYQLSVSLPSSSLSLSPARTPPSISPSPSSSPPPLFSLFFFFSLQLPASDKPRALLIFGATEWEIDSEDFFARFSKYDTFTKEDWLSLKTDSNAKKDQGMYEDGLFAYMEPHKET